MFVVIVFVVAGGADSGQAGNAALGYSMCVDKVLHMQRVFLTELPSNDDDDAENSSQTTATTAAAAAAAGTEASSSPAEDAASSDTSAAEAGELTLPVQTAPVQHMDLSDWLPAPKIVCFPTQNVQ